MKYCPECGGVKGHKQKCKCGFLFAEEKMEVIEKCDVCGTKNDLSLHHRWTDSRHKNHEPYFLCERHYRIAAKNELVQKLGFQYCKDHGVLAWGNN